MSARFLNLFGRSFVVRKTSEDIFEISSQLYKNRYGNIVKTHLNEHTVGDFIEKSNLSNDRDINTLYINSFTFLDMECFEVFNKTVANHECKTTNLMVHQGIIDPFCTNLIFKNNKVFDECYCIDNGFHVNKLILDKILNIEDDKQTK